MQAVKWLLDPEVLQTQAQIQYALHGNYQLNFSYYIEIPLCVTFNCTTLILNWLIFT